MIISDAPLVGKTQYCSKKFVWSPFLLNLTQHLSKISPIRPTGPTIKFVSTRPTTEFISNQPTTKFDKNQR